MDSSEKQQVILGKPKAIHEPRRVFVIDDSEDMRTLERTVLEMDGYSVSTAESGAEAFEILTHDYEPDLILLDMKMAEMDGPEFLEMLAEKRPDLIIGVPVVFLTGMDHVPKGRCVGFVRKPILDMKKFLADVHQYIEDGLRVRHFAH